MRPCSRRTLRSAAAALALLPLPHAGFAEGGLEPWQMVRSLQLVQDRLADGDHAALPMQRKLLEMIDGRLRRADPAEFEDQRNFRALLVYAMSGGNPSTAREIVGRLSLDDARMKLGAGVTDYVTGRIGKASETFKDVDPLAYPAELGAFLALVKGAVLATENPQQAVFAFDQARLLGPGTLVEEAAARRLLMLHAEAGDAARFQRAAIQYVTRFLRSPYATQFAEAYVAGIVRLHGKIDLHSIEETVAHMNEEQAKVIYLRLARKSAVDGYPDLLAFAAQKASRWAAPADGKADPRAQLYASIGSITSSEVGDVLAILKSIDRARLSPEDRELLRAAEAIASRVTAEPPMLQEVRVDIPAETPADAAAISTGAEAADESEMTNLVSIARAKLDAIDELLKETSK